MSTIAFEIKNNNVEQQSIKVHAKGHDVAQLGRLLDLCNNLGFIESNNYVFNLCNKQWFIVMQKIDFNGNVIPTNVQMQDKSCYTRQILDMTLLEPFGERTHHRLRVVFIVDINNLNTRPKKAYCYAVNEIVNSALNVSVDDLESEPATNGAYTNALINLATNSVTAISGTIKNILGVKDVDDPNGFFLTIEQAFHWRRNFPNDYIGDENGGLYKEWSATGTLIRQIAYKNGMRHGKCKIVNEKENTYEIKTFHNGRLTHDPVVRGKIDYGSISEIEHCFISNQPHGIAKYKDRRGEIYELRTFVYGKLQGRCMRFYQICPSNNGVVVNENGIKGHVLNENDSYNKYLIDETFLGIAENKAYLDNEIHGKFTCWHRNGKKSSECTYNKGYIKGTKTYWHTSGRIMKEETYIDGEKNKSILGSRDVLKEYHIYFDSDSGSLSELSKRDDNGYELERTTWTETGEMIAQIIVKTNKNESQWTEETKCWYATKNNNNDENKDGERRQIKKSEIVKIDSRKKYWNLIKYNNISVKLYWPNGEMRKMRTYLAGRLVNKITDWYFNGQIAIEGSVESTGAKTFRTGTWNYYYDNGNIKKTEFYGENGALKKAVKFHYSNEGEIISELEFVGKRVTRDIRISVVDGKRKLMFGGASVSGTFTRWDTDGSVLAIEKFVAED